mmetsp:Transcript_6152/g.3478  ORF Transcript_6152/g.3478 Transcript_6152/m.3478 type:complete len:103 (-) Transcript_6152:19-327(-)
MYYESGILDGDCSGSVSDLDHAITAVGYDSEDRTPYWLLKNSWGTGWGENGYIRILRTDSGTSVGLCGIANYITYPIALNAVALHYRLVLLVILLIFILFSL